MKILHVGFWVAFFIISLCPFKKVKAEQPWNIRSVSPKKEKTLEGKIFNLSEPNKFFTGREQEIEKVANVLFKEKETVLVIEGVSGIGKTQLAKKYAYSFLDKYDLIWWFNAEKNMETQVDELLKEIYQRESKPYYRPANLLNLIRKLNYELDSLKSNWLIIFDNVDEIKSINEYVPFKGTDLFLKHVIVTSKKMNRTFSSLTMQKFQRKESLTFLSKILEEEKEKELNALAETLEDFPLALTQAASYIKMNPSINVKTYLQLFKESLSELWKAEEKLIEGKKANQALSDSYNKTIYTAIKININSIKDRSSLAYEMLCFCSLLNHQHIPLDVLERWACSKHGASKIEFHEALSILLNYFLLEEEKSLKDKKNSKLFNQHELIQLITLETINNDSKKFILKEASECILQELTYSPETLFEQFKGKEHFYNHMEKLYHLAEKLNFNNGSILELKIAHLYYIHFIQHNFARATALIFLIKNQVGKADNISPLAKIWFYCIIINDRMFEDWSEVEKSYKKVLECLELIKDKETKNSYLLHATIDYAESLSNFGRIKEAIAVCDNLEEALKTTENKSEKIAFLSSSALVRIKYGQYEQALKEVERCLKLISKQDGTENYIPFLMVKKANCLLYQRKEKEAFQIIEEYYPHLLEVYESPECIVLVRAQLIKGACLSALGNLDEAMNVIEKSLYPYEKTSGFGNDTLKGMGYRLLGEIFEANGEFLKAFDKYTKAEKLYNQILQEKTLDDLSLLYMRLAILGTRVRDDTMVKKYLSLQIENFGLAHPRTFEIKKYLDCQNLSLP